MGVLSGPQRSVGCCEAIAPRSVIVTAGSNRRKVIRAPTEELPSWPLRALRLRVSIDGATTA